MSRTTAFTVLVLMVVIIGFVLLAGLDTTVTNRTVRQQPTQTAYPTYTPAPTQTPWVVTTTPDEARIAPTIAPTADWAASFTDEDLMGLATISGEALNSATIPEACVREEWVQISRLTSTSMMHDRALTVVQVYLYADRTDDYCGSVRISIFPDQNAAQLWFFESQSQIEFLAIRGEAYGSDGEYIGGIADGEQCSGDICEGLALELVTANYLGAPLNLVIQYDFLAEGRTSYVDTETGVTVLSRSNALEAVRTYRESFIEPLMEALIVWAAQR